MIDTMLGKYRILQRLGEGGMGTVYKARDELIDRIVAIKVLRPELTRNAQLLERFRAEAVALARLNHPRIAILHGLEQNGEELYMVMEFLPGETVEKMIKRLERVPWQRAIEIAVEVLDALDHAHDMGVVHRDIKPANVMVSPNGSVKVMDFGIARITGRDRNTRVGHTVGTPVYMSPEQLRGEEVDGRADIYAIGGMLFEMLTGRVTFEADSDYELMMKQLNEPPPLAGAFAPDVPPSLDAAVSRALAKSREERFVSASAMKAALLASAEGVRARLRTPASYKPAVDPKATRLAGELASEGADQPGHISSGGFHGIKGGFNSDPTRVGAASGDVGATRIASPAFDTGASNAPNAPIPWSKDWRMWATAAALVLAVGIAAGGMMKKKPLPPPTTVAQVPPSVPTNGAAAGNGTTPAVTPSSGATSLPDPAPGTSGSPARVIGAPPVPVPPRDSAPPADPPAKPRTDPPATTPPSTKPPAKKVTPPSRVVTAQPTPPTTPPARSGTAGGAGSAGSTGVSGSTGTGSGSSNAGESGRSESGASRSEAFTAAENFLRLFRDKDAGTLGSAISDASGLSKLLDLVREGRASAGAPTNLEINGNSIAFSTTLTWRSSFGANRKGTMSVSGSLAQSGGTWRITRARLTELPEIK